jgi:hypothetical protein
MINGKDKADNYLKNLVQKADLESPSPNFTDNVMHQIQAEHQLSAQITDGSAWFKNYFFLIIAGVAAVSYAIYYMVSNDISIFPGDFDPILVPVFGKILVSLKEMFQSVQVSSFTVVIIVAVLGLFIIDRLLRRFQAGRQTYFSF